MEVLYLLFRKVSRLDIIDRTDSATPEWIERWGRFSVEADPYGTNAIRLTGDDLAAILDDLWKQVNR